MEYPAIFEPAEEGGFIVRFPDFDWESPRETPGAKPKRWPRMQFAL
jgi:hypothetical protein